MPLITVYITNYNYGKYIRKAIESVLNQTFSSFELIIIDDGSTDSSKEIIAQYESHSKIQLIFQQNKGLNVTNNIALRVARGKYIMRLDADDYLDPNALLVMSDMLEKDEDLGLVFPDYFLVDAEDHVFHVERRNDFEKEVSLPDQPAHGACTMIRKKFLQQLGGYDEQYRCQDGYELWVKFIAKYKVKNINTPLFYYRQHGSNLTSDENKILSTRALIKENFTKQQQIETPKVLALIPIRGKKQSTRNAAFIQLQNDFLVDIKIREAAKAEKTHRVIISSPDPDIQNHIRTKYASHPKIRFHKRDAESARLNVSLTDTVNRILELDEIRNENYRIVLVLPVEYPFIDAAVINDAVNTLLIFNTDSVISVREETNMFFRHDGSGMKPILNQEKFSKLEREAIYKNTGGIIAFRVDDFRKSQQIITGKVGHIVVSQKAAHGIKSKFDIEIAQFLYAKADESVSLP